MTEDHQSGRVCTQCGEHKPASEFSWRRRPQRLTSRCLSCRRAAYHENPERVRQRAREWYAANRDRAILRDVAYRRDRVARVLLGSARLRARKAGVPFDLVEGDIVVPDHCPVLGMPLVVNQGRSRPDSPSLDRIIPTLGYIRGNVIVVSHRANTIKSDATVAELFAVASFYAGRLAEEVA